MSKKTVVLVVMDGVGISKTHLGDAVTEANTPTLDRLWKECPHTTLKAHGDAVGLPTDDDMGNSEVGHNALGCGQIYSQGAKLVNESIASGKMFESATWKKLISNVKDNGSTFHFLGLLSDGNVHSNIAHLKTMLAQCKKEGVAKVRCHILLDGRDVPATSAPIYIEDLEKCIAELNDASFDAQIASGGGRMKITMDRYQADWGMVELGWNTHVHGQGRQFATALEAVEALRGETEAIDQDLPPFVIAKDGKPVGKVEDNDSVVLFNFRGDRALEISMAFDGKDDFNFFDRGAVPKVIYAGMLEYDGDLTPAGLEAKARELTGLTGAVNERDYPFFIVGYDAGKVNTGMGITLRTLSSQKLKQSLSDSVKDMDEFTKDFILAQARVQNKPIAPKLKSYDTGDEVIVRVTAIDQIVHVETVDPSYNKIQGTICYDRPSLVYYYTNDLYKYFHVGDYLTATITDPIRSTFSIQDQLIKFFVEYTEECVNYDGDSMTAKLIDEKPNYTEWLTEIGVAICVDGKCDYRRGEYATIAISEFGTGKFYGLIHGFIKKDTDETFDEKTARHDCIREFAEFTQPPIYQHPEEDTAELSPVLLRLLLSSHPTASVIWPMPISWQNWLTTVFHPPISVLHAPICEHSSSLSMTKTLMPFRLNLMRNTRWPSQRSSVFPLSTS